MRRLGDWRLLMLASAVLMLGVALLRPHWPTERSVYDLVAIVDITRSMNTRDRQVGNTTVSRLDYVRHGLGEWLRRLPCGSRLGIGVFTERRSTLLMMPVEVCRYYHELHEVIVHLDWRMAWAADSRIAQGLEDTIKLWRKNAELQDSALLFVTDGHEAPPINPRYKPDFSRLRGEVGGMIVGAGGSRLTPIPKFDETGKQIGFYQPEDVPHRSTFGIPSRDYSDLPGYHPRNAPFGGERIEGSEHLSSRKDAYLRELAGQAGLTYRPLSEIENPLESFDRAGLALRMPGKVDLGPALILLALFFLLSLYALTGWLDRFNRKP
ncbi:MAG: vWA domain-containing protein [Methylohalobius sp. ZOD2]